MTELDDVLDRNGHLTELACERLAAELRDGTPDEDPSFTRLARGHYAGCAPCQTSVAALAEPMALPPLPLPIPLHAPTRRAPKRAAWWAGALALAATALIAAFIVTRPDDSGIRLKGGSFDFEVQDAGGRVLGDEATVRPGDALYFALRVGEPAWVAVWGVDARGERYTIREAGRFDPTQAPVRLPQAIELDAEGERETIVARMCPHTFTPDDAVVADDCATRSVVLRKLR